jgi:hypothetical protein
MKRIFLLVSILSITLTANAQQIGNGIATLIDTFNTLLPSGIYMSNKAQPNYPKELPAWPFKYLFVSRANVTPATCEFQISSTIGYDDRVFFRKIVKDNNNPNCDNDWYEFATRGKNTFTEDQHIWSNHTLSFGDPTDAHRRLRFSFVSNSTFGDAYVDYGGNLYFRRAGNSLPIACFTSQGNFILGFQSSNEKKTLTVNGTIFANEVQIKADVWADYVFSEDYKLPALNEVKQHIDKNKHLPGIPSEKEVIEKGINLGEMQSKLLQKIEELTLYVIQQNEKIQVLESKLNELENK